MDLIDRNQLLQMIEKAEKEFENKGKFLRCRHFMYIVNKMPSVQEDIEWAANYLELDELLTK